MYERKYVAVVNKTMSLHHHDTHVIRRLEEKNEIDRRAWPHFD